MLLAVRAHYAFWTLEPYLLCNLQIFSHLMTLYSVDAPVFNLAEIQFFHFVVITCAFRVTAKNPLPNQSYEDIFLFSSKGFKVVSLISRSLLHFKLIFIWCKVSNFILFHVYIQLSQHHFLKRLLVPP